MPFAILFNLVIFVFIAAMWILFIANIIRAAKRNTTRNNTSRTTRTSQTMTRTQRQQTLDRQSQTNRNQRTATTTNKSLQTLLRQNPAELYRTLKEQLPERYKKELQDIFNSPNPAVELIRFLRRKDVWPLVQNLLRQEGQPAETSRRHPTAERDMVPRPVAAHRSQLDEDIEEIALASSSFESEQEQLMEEYDSYGVYFDELLSDIGLGDDVSSLQRVERLEAKKAKAKVDQKWLQDAMVAKEILDRPDF